MTKIDRVSIIKDDRKIYSEISKQKMFKRMSNKNIFELAMCLGIRNKHKISYGSKPKDGFFNLKDLSNKEISLFNAIAVAEVGNLEILVDKGRVFSIAEEYANGGIHILRQEMFGNTEEGDFEKRLELLLRREVQKNIKKP